MIFTNLTVKSNGIEFQPTSTSYEDDFEVKNHRSALFNLKLDFNGVEGVQITV